MGQREMWKTSPALAARIESEPDTCNKAFAWLKEESGLLKSSCDGNLQLIPPPLHDGAG